MSRRLSRPGRVWVLLFIGVVVGLAGIVLADRQLGNQTLWRILTRRDRQEAEALALGHRYLEKGQNRRAIEAVSRIPGGSPNEAEALTIRGLALASLEEVVPARRDLERAWSLQPNSAAARVLAAIYLSAYENERGLQMLLNATRIDPKDFRPWYAMGELVYLRLRRYPLAIDAFQKALERLPGHPESRIGLADALVKYHRPEEAESALKGVLEQRPDDPRVLTLAAEIAMELGREPDAAQYLERSLAIDPDRCETLVLHARVQFRRGHPNESLSDMERACSLDPNDLTAIDLLRSIQSTLGLKEQAAQTQARRHEVERRNEKIESLLRDILQHPNDPEMRCRLGRIAAEAGMKVLAAQSYQAALALSPNSEPARQGLIELGYPPSQLTPVGGATLAGPRR